MTKSTEARDLGVFLESPTPLPLISNLHLVSLNITQRSPRPSCPPRLPPSGPAYVVSPLDNGSHPFHPVFIRLRLPSIFNAKCCLWDLSKTHAWLCYPLACKPSVAPHCLRKGRNPSIWSMQPFKIWPYTCPTSSLIVQSGWTPGDSFSLPSLSFSPFAPAVLSAYSFISYIFSVWAFLLFLPRFTYPNPPSSGLHGNDACSNTALFTLSYNTCSAGPTATLNHDCLEGWHWIMLLSPQCLCFMGAERIVNAWWLSVEWMNDLRCPLSPFHHYRWHTTTVFPSLPSVLQYFILILGHFMNQVFHLSFLWFENSGLIYIS